MMLKKIKYSNNKTGLRNNYITMLFWGGGALNISPCGKASWKFPEKLGRANGEEKSPFKRV